jgi:phosphoribosylamine---glycine ligase
VSPSRSCRSARRASRASPSDEPLRVLVVGGGGREHALVWAISRSPVVEQVVATPGNAGIAEIAECMLVAADDISRIAAIADERAVDLVVVGPEGPLVAGLTDLLRSRGTAVFGPDREAARIEGSKAWAKRVMAAGGIPTARSATFDSVVPALAFVDELGGRAVVKADGLAAGKGVTVANDRATAEAALRACIDDGVFADAGASVVVEEILEGAEVSAFALSDGDGLLPLSLSRDFKRVGEGDTGPNTGGMGAYSPLPSVDESTESEIWKLAERTIGAMRGEGIEYRGLLYLGLMLTEEGPKVLEYNCRFGDPETQVVLPRITCDVAGLLHAAATGSLGEKVVSTSGGSSVAVVIASGGYPGDHRKGLEIFGLEDAAGVEGVMVFHSGTQLVDGRVVTAGGRVLTVSALGRTQAEARSRAYEACSRISFEGMQYRRDIAAG